MSGYLNITELVGKSFTSVRRDEDDRDGIIFENDTETYRLYHEQDCCESVGVEEIHGDLKDLEGAVIRVATEDKNYEPEGHIPAQDDYDDVAEQWCFYTFRTIKGTVTVRFYGTSNGYYATDANLYRD